MKRERPELTIILNGGIGSLDEAERHLTQVDGVMLGRAAYHAPAMLADVDARFFAGAAPLQSRRGGSVRRLCGAAAAQRRAAATR